MVSISDCPVSAPALAVTGTTNASTGRAWKKTWTRRPRVHPDSVYATALKGGVADAGSLRVRQRRSTATSISPAQPAKRVTKRLGLLGCGWKTARMASAFVAVLVSSGSMEDAE